MPERNVFFPGMRAFVGYDQVPLDVHRPARVAGRPRVTLRAKLSYGLNALFAFSNAPLRLASWLGLIVAAGGAILALVYIYLKYVVGNAVPGFTGLLIVVLFLGGVQLITLGVIGEYIGRDLRRGQAAAPLPGRRGRQPRAQAGRRDGDRVGRGARVAPEMAAGWRRSPASGTALLLAGMVLVGLALRLPSFERLPLRRRPLDELRRQRLRRRQHLRHPRERPGGHAAAVLPAHLADQGLRRHRGPAARLATGGDSLASRSPTCSASAPSAARRDWSARRSSRSAPSRSSTRARRAPTR